MKEGCERNRYQWQRLSLTNKGVYNMCHYSCSSGFYPTYTIVHTAHENLLNLVLVLK